MAQKLIELKRQAEKFKECSTQTEKEISPEFFIQLAKNKHMKLYKSKVYRQFVLSFNINNSKKIVISKPMWMIFRKYFKQIDGAFMDNRQ